MPRPRGGCPALAWSAALLCLLTVRTGPPAFALDPHRAVTQYMEHRWTCADGLPCAAIEALSQDAKGYLWIRTAAGTVRFDGQSFVPAEPGPLGALPEDGLAASSPELLDRGGNRWRGSPQGLLRISPSGLGFAESGEILALLDPPVSVTCLFEDRGGNLWIGTGASGLFRLTDGDFRLWGSRQGLSSSAARTVVQDRSGALWIGTDGGGLNRLQGRTVTSYSTADGLSSDVVLALFETPPGTLWIGTAGGGLNRLRSGEITHFSTRDGLTSAAVTSLFGDRQGTLWIGTAGGGLNRFRRGMFEAFTTADGLSNDIVRALLQDRDGDLWIGTDAGLNRFRNGQITTYTTADGLAGDQILALHQDRSGILWVGTDAGLSRRRGLTFLSYTQRDGLHNDGLRQILDDYRGRLWFCSNKGLFYLQQRSLAPGRRLSSLALPEARYLDCSGYNQPAAWQGDDGRMWFATNSGVLELNPQEVTPPPPPPVVLESVLAGGRSFAVDEPARLPSGSRDVDFQFTALDLSGTSRVRFRYRLDPFDRDWTDNGDRRRARYTNLPTGSFRFRVAASTGTLWSHPEAVFQLDVPKPFHRTKAAVSIMMLLVLVLSRGLYQLRVQHLVRRNQRLARQVAESTRQAEIQRGELDQATQHLEEANQRLAKANEELFELDQENTDLLALAAHDLREPLVTLRGFTSELYGVLGVLETAAADLSEDLRPDRRQRLSQALREDAPEALSFIDTSTERMDQLIQGLLGLSRLGRQELHFERLDIEALVQKVLRNLRYRISLQGAEVEIRSLPPVVADRTSMKLVFENLLNNAVLYLRPECPGRIVISGTSDAEGRTYRVSDNGRGITEAARPKIFQLFGRGDSQGPEEERIAGEGLGLAFVRTTIERHGGSIDFESLPGEGTTFFFSLPHLPVERRDA